MIMHRSTTASHESLSPSKMDVFEFDPSGTKSSSAAAPRHSSGYDDQDDDLPVSTMPGRGEASPGNTALIRNGNRGSGTQPFSTMQMVARPDSSTSYRIPSSVFRTKSSTVGDWSVASNESLFSIHTGNASFTREQLAWMDRSSDEQMFLPTDTDLLFSGPLLDFNRPAETENCQNVVQEQGKLQQHQLPEPQPGSSVTGLSVNVTVPTPVDLPPIKLASPSNADELTKETSLAKGVAQSPASSRVSDNESCKSFAFPVLSRNDTSGLATPKQPVLAHSPRPTEPSSTKTNQKPDPDLQPQPQPAVQPAKKPEAASSSAAANNARCTWFSCFTGCGAAPRSG